MRPETATKQAAFSTHADLRRNVPEPETMPKEDAGDAILELTLLAADGLKGGATFLGKAAKPFAVAWVDPALIRKSPIPLNSSSSNPPKLHLPLSFETLQNPSSSLTVQILSSRLPFRAAKPVASAVITLSSLLAAGEPFVLPLRRPSGRPHASLHLSARILWCLAPAPSSDPVDGAPVVAGVPSIPTEVEAPEFFWVEPSAPPYPAPLPPPMPMAERIGPWKSFLIGLASGAVAAVLMGAAVLSGD
ncbi:uncharacterized protein [Elaeis guineensis]|uniref:uncharacterized protein n=1 Tax=Elaeis guineensis var. tenera TaxID=51953 RepID=UPI003C6CEBF0